MTVSGEVLFEFRRVGNAVKITALHCETLTEIHTQAPYGATEAQMKALALNKLGYVLAKKQGQT